MAHALARGALGSACLLLFTTLVGCQAGPAPQMVDRQQPQFVDVPAPPPVQPQPRNATPQKISPRPGLALVQHVDGFGTRSEKNATWNRLKRPEQFHLGYKLFLDEDVKRYGAADVLKFKPVPELISFQ